jgi:hypothetical protein
MASWVVRCLERAHAFSHTLIEAGLIEQAFRDPFHILPKPQILWAGEKRTCPRCKKKSVNMRSQLFYRAA